MASRPKAPEPVPAPAAAPVPKKQKRYKRDPNKPKRAYCVKPGMKPGRPPYVPSEESRHLVVVMVAGGIQQKEIAAALKIDHTTLCKHYRDELDQGMVRANTQVVANLYRQTKDNVRAAEFWLTNRDAARWAHKQRIDAHVDMNVSVAERVKRARSRIKGE